MGAYVPTLVDIIHYTASISCARVTPVLRYSALRPNRLPKGALVVAGPSAEGQVLRGTGCRPRTAAGRWRRSREWGGPLRRSHDTHCVLPPPAVPPAADGDTSERICFESFGDILCPLPLSLSPPSFPSPSSRPLATVTRYRRCHGLWRTNLSLGERI